MTLKGWVEQMSETKLCAASDELWCPHWDVVMKTRFVWGFFALEQYHIPWPYIVKDWKYYKKR